MGSIRKVSFLNNIDLTISGAVAEVGWGGGNRFVQHWIGKSPLGT